MNQTIPLPPIGKSVRNNELRYRNPNTDTLDLGGPDYNAPYQAPRGKTFFIVSLVICFVIFATCVSVLMVDFYDYSFDIGLAWRIVLSIISVLLFLIMIFLIVTLVEILNE